MGWKKNSAYDNRETTRAAAAAAAAAVATQGPRIMRAGVACNSISQLIGESDDDCTFELSFPSAGLVAGGFKNKQMKNGGETWWLLSFPPKEQQSFSTCERVRLAFLNRQTQKSINSPSPGLHALTEGRSR